MVQPSFQGFMRATGHAEVWEDDKKFQQFGWRTTTSESAYSTDTLIGNWNEERFDVQKIAKAKPLPSQVFAWIVAEPLIALLSMLVRILRIYLCCND